MQLVLSSNYAILSLRNRAHHAAKNCQAENKELIEKNTRIMHEIRLKSRLEAKKKLRECGIFRVVSFFNKNVNLRKWLIFYICLPVEYSDSEDIVIHCTRNDKYKRIMALIGLLDHYFDSIKSAPHDSFIFNEEDVKLIKEYST